MQAKYSTWVSGYESHIIEVGSKMFVVTVAKGKQLHPQERKGAENSPKEQRSWTSNAFAMTTLKKSKLEKQTSAMTTFRAISACAYREHAERAGIRWFQSCPLQFLRGGRHPMVKCVGRVAPRTTVAVLIDEIAQQASERSKRALRRSADSGTLQSEMWSSMARGWEGVRIRTRASGNWTPPNWRLGSGYLPSGHYQTKVQWLKVLSQCFAILERWAYSRSGKLRKMVKIIYIIE